MVNTCTSLHFMTKEMPLVFSDIVNLPYLDSNIPVRSAYGVYTSQLVRIGRICVDFTSFVDRHRLLTAQLIKQGFLYSKLWLTFFKFTKKHSHILGGTLRQHINSGISHS